MRCAIVAQLSLFLGPIAGRSDDILHFASGRAVGRFDPVFKGFTEVLEAQIEQTSPTSLIVRVVPSSGYCARDRTADGVGDTKESRG